jgi:hypothetical protein
MLIRESYVLHIGGVAFQRTSVVWISENLEIELVLAQKVLVADDLQLHQL